MIFRKSVWFIASARKQIYKRFIYRTSPLSDVQYLRLFEKYSDRRDKLVYSSEREWEINNFEGQLDGRDFKILSDFLFKQDTTLLASHTIRGNLQSSENKHWVHAVSEGISVRTPLIVPLAWFLQCIRRDFSDGDFTYIYFNFRTIFHFFLFLFYFFDILRVSATKDANREAVGLFFYILFSCFEHFVLRNNWIEKRYVFIICRINANALDYYLFTRDFIMLYVLDEYRAKKIRKSKWKIILRRGITI